MVNIKAVDLARALKIKPKKVADFLKVSLGKKINKGDLLASKKTLFGQEKKLYSPVDGFVEKFEEKTGFLLIRQMNKKPFLFKETKKATFKIKGAYGFGQTKGKLKHFNQNLKIETLKVDLTETIVAAPFINSLGVFYKLAALGALGLVVNQIKKKWFASLNQAKLIGNFDFSFLVLGEKIDLLKKYQQSQVICNGENKVLLVL